MTISLICRFLSHQFGDWEYVSDGSCKQVRTCKRDGVQQELVDHDWRIECMKEGIERVDYDIRRFDDTLLIPHDEYWDGGVKTTVTVWRCTRCGNQTQATR